MVPRREHTKLSAWHSAGGPVVPRSTKKKSSTHASNLAAQQPHPANRIRVTPTAATAPLASTAAPHHASHVCWQTAVVNPVPTWPWHGAHAKTYTSVCVLLRSFQRQQHSVLTSAAERQSGLTPDPARRCNSLCLGPHIVWHSHTHTRARRYS